MPGHPPSELVARPAQQSVVLVRPTGLLVAMTLLLGSLLLLINTLKLADSPMPGHKVAGALLGLGMLLGASYQLARGNRPRLLRFDREALHLEPLGPEQGSPAETIALRSITAYTYWLRLLRWRGFAQCHLRLELADGRVLHLADRPGPRPKTPPDVVGLDAVAQKLPRWLTPGVRRRPLFYLTAAARRLLWLN